MSVHAADIFGFAPSLMRLTRKGIETIVSSHGRNSGQKVRPLDASNGYRETAKSAEQRAKVGDLDYVTDNHVNSLHYAFLVDHTYTSAAPNFLWQMNSILVARASNFVDISSSLLIQ